jgi:hypothetical protein
MSQRYNPVLITLLRPERRAACRERVKEPDGQKLTETDKTSDAKKAPSLPVCGRSLVNFKDPVGGHAFVARNSGVLVRANGLLGRNSDDTVNWVVGQGGLTWQ